MRVLCDLDERENLLTNQINYNGQRYKIPEDFLKNYNEDNHEKELHQQKRQKEITVQITNNKEMREIYIADLKRQ